MTHNSDPFNSSCPPSLVSLKGQEQYVRLRAGRDGGEFLFPAGVLAQLSGTMKGMVSSGEFLESRALVTVPSSAKDKAVSDISSLSSCSHDPTEANQIAEAITLGDRGWKPMNVIAVDGPAASGKGTLCRSLASRLNFAHLDTGSLYRATALRVLRSAAEGEGLESARQSAPEEARAITDEDLRSPELRSERVGEEASVLSADQRVRAALLQFQREFASSPPHGAAGAVLDGRDIGTNICPAAPLKLFLTAEHSERAKRRHAELLSAGQTLSLEQVEADLRRRDERDSQRAANPLAPAPDAILIDTSTKGEVEVLGIALNEVAKAFPNLVG